MKIVATSVALSSACSNYIVIADATRSVNYSAASTCDTATFNSTPQWVRFSGSGTQIPTSVVNIYLCGTDAPGYYTGTMPAVGATANGTVCYNWSGYACNWYNSILVTNCNGFYVYSLIVPPVCNLRYCTV